MWRSTLSIAFGVLLALGAVTPGVARQNSKNVPAAPGLGAPGGLQLGSPSNYFAPHASAVALVQSGAVTGSKGIAAFSHPATGIYCFEIVSKVPPTTVPVVSIEWGASLGVNLFAQWDQFNDDCSDATDHTLEVLTYKGDTGGVGSSYQIPVLSDQVAFVVYLP